MSNNANEELCNDLNNELYDELLYVEDKVISSIPHIESLEAFTYNDNGKIHSAKKTGKCEDVGIFQPFWEYQDGDEYENISKFNICYNKVRYTFNRVSTATVDYKTFILISKEKINGENFGMLVVRDTSGVMFVATCREVNLRQLNLDLIPVIYGD